MLDSNTRWHEKRAFDRVYEGCCRPVEVLRTRFCRPRERNSLTLTVGNVAKQIQSDACATEDRIPSPTGRGRHRGKAAVDKNTIKPREVLLVAVVDEAKLEKKVDVSGAEMWRWRTRR